MNPNLTVSYMAAQANLQQLDRSAERGWMAEQAAKHRDVHKSVIASTFKRVTAAIFERPCQVVREATNIDSYPRLDRVG